jgi:hypothetical protein
MSTTLNANADTKAPLATTHVADAVHRFRIWLMRSLGQNCPEEAGR